MDNARPQTEQPSPTAKAQRAPQHKETTAATGHNGRSNVRTHQHNPQNTLTQPPATVTTAPGCTDVTRTHPAQQQPDQPTMPGCTNTTGMNQCQGATDTPAPECQEHHRTKTTAATAPGHQQRNNGRNSPRVQQTRAPRHHRCNSAKTTDAATPRPQINSTETIGETAPGHNEHNSDRMQQHRDNGCNDAEKQDATSPGQQTKMSEHNSAQTQHTPLQHNSQTD